MACCLFLSGYRRRQTRLIVCEPQFKEIFHDGSFDLEDPGQKMTIWTRIPQGKEHLLEACIEYNDIKGQGTKHKVLGDKADH